MLTVYIDFKSAASYLALQPTLDLAARTGTRIDWKPYRTQAWQMPVETSDETVGQRHRRVRAEARRATVLKYAALQGLPLHMPEASGQTDLALAVLATLQDEPLPFIQACFAAYWVARANLDDAAVISALMAEAGLAVPTTFTTLCAEFEVAQERAETSGIVEAPAYLVADQMFIGREHLPWIEQLLVGEISAL